MDPQQQQLANSIAGMGAGIVAFALLFSLAFIAFMIWLYWRIFTRAGMAGALSLLFLVPAVGWLIVPCILAFSRWNVAPVPPGYDAGLAPYPPAYPPSSYPTSGPPTQL